MRYCECEETSYLRARGYPLPASHECGYVKDRSRLARVIYETMRRAVGKDHVTAVDYLARVDAAWRERSQAS